MSDGYGREENYGRDFRRDDGGGYEKNDYNDRQGNKVENF